MKAKTYTRNIAEACEEYNKIFGANKNLYRIFISMQDGLKPVERRFIYAMYKSKGRNKFIKMVKATANTVDYHPHGDSSITDVGAKLAQVQTNNVTTIEGHGNFGSYKDADAAAARYIECKLSKYSYKCFFEDFENSNVDMKLAYTGDDEEPEVLPARYPHALFNPQLSGIGYAFASNIPPFNMREVIKALVKLIENPNAKIMLVPDSPTGADIVDDGNFKKINETGVGTFTLRGSVEVDESKNILTITSIPLQITIDKIIQNIVTLKKEKKLFEDITDIKDYTNNKNGVKTFIYLKPTANPYKIIDELYSKNVGLKKTYPVAMKMIDDYQDYDYTPKTFLLAWLESRRDGLRSSYNTQLVKKMEDYHMNEALLFVFNADNSEKTLQIAKSAENKEDHIRKLVKAYKGRITSLQAKTISEMRSYQYNKDSYAGFKQKKKDLEKEISEIEYILAHDEEIDKKIIEQVEEGAKLFGRERQSKIVSDESKKDVPNIDYIVALSKDGYCKKVPVGTDTIGKVGDENGQCMTIKINNRENLLLFDASGKVYRIAVSSIPELTKEDKGVQLERYFSVHDDVISVTIEPKETKTKKGSEVYVLFVTRNGYMKRTPLTEFLKIKGSKTSIRLEDDDKLVSALIVLENTSDDVIIYTNKGDGVRLDINQFNVYKASARGLKQIKLMEDEYVVGIDTIDTEKKYLLYITSSGRVKITELKYFPLMKRNEETLSLINLEKNDSLVGIKAVTKKERVVVYKKNTPSEELYLKDMPVTSRIGKAEKKFKTPKGDSVIAYTLYK